MDLNKDTLKDTFIIDPKEYNDDVELLGSEVMKSRKEAAKKKTKQEEIRSEYSINDIKKFALDAIYERMKFCRDYKTDESFDKCVCESVKRYIRLFKDSPMKGDKKLTKLRLDAIEKLFNEMKKDGKIICLDDSKDDSDQPKQPV